MPKIGKIDDCTVFFYTNEGQLEGLPRVHLARPDAEAEFLISHDEVPVVMLRRSIGFNEAELSNLRTQLAPIAVEIRSAWNNLFC